MDFPTENWIIANIIGVVIYTVMFIVFDLALKIPFNISTYIVCVAIYIVIAIVDFYIYHKSSLVEEKKPIELQLRDMLGSFGISVLILVIMGIYIMHQRKKQLAKIVNIINSFPKKQ